MGLEKKQYDVIYADPPWRYKDKHDGWGCAGQ